ncbi:hypothetical protein V6N13_102104 [Hibiscus sabdariffa]
MRRGEVSSDERVSGNGKVSDIGQEVDVAEAFIARKRNAKGRRFGFVRYRNRTDALRATERLNGFFLYGSKISVTPAKYKRRDAYWNKVKPEEKGNPNYRGQSDMKKEDFIQETKDVSRETKPRKEGEASKMNLSRREDGETSFWNSRRKQRIAGHIEVEELWNRKRCLVGEMASVCSVNSVSTRLSEWGLG